MSNSSFNIKFFSGHPVFAYEDGEKLPSVISKGYDYEVIKTIDKWGHVYDSFNGKRTIQSFMYEKYETYIVAANNLDFFKLQSANHVYIVPEIGAGFYAVNVIVTKEKSLNRDNLIKLEFWRQISIDNELSSDFAESSYTSSTTNKLTYTVNNPTYSFNNITTYYYEVEVGVDTIAFKVPLNGLTNTIEIDDTYYMHTDNTAFNSLTDGDGDFLNAAKCYNKDSDYVYFYCSVNEATGIFTIGEITLDHNQDRRGDSSSEFTIADKIITVNIYTFLNPIYYHEDNEIKGVENAARKNNQKIKSNDRMNCKVWLTDAEMWKAEYLKYADHSNVLMNLVDQNNIIPAEMREIIKQNPKRNILGLHEYELNLRYNIKEVGVNV